MTQNKSICSILIIIIVSTFAIHLCGKNKLINKYEFQYLDRSNTQQVDQVRQLFASSSIQAINEYDSQDLEKWIDNDAYEFLLAINTNGSICSCAVYFISKHQTLHLETIAISTKYQWHDITTQLLQQLELIPNKVKICTFFTQKDIEFYKFFQELKYIQTNEYVTLCKKINKDLVASNINNSVYTIRFLDRQNLEEIKLFSKLFHADEVGGTWTPEEMQEFTTRKSYQFLVAFDANNQPCAGLIYKTSSTTNWEFHVFAVDKNYRRQGIATAMLQTIAQLALQSNIQELTLSVLPTNYKAVACYKKQDFIEKEILYKMEKEINNVSL